MSKRDHRIITMLLMWMDYHTLVAWNGSLNIAATELYWKCLLVEIMALELTPDEVWKLFFTHQLR